MSAIQAGQLREIMALVVASGTAGGVGQAELIVALPRGRAADGHCHCRRRDTTCDYIRQHQGE
jgi:hypothetical protein